MVIVDYRVRERVKVKSKRKRVKQKQEINYTPTDKKWSKLSFVLL